jgi:hypothetical protein
MLLVWIAATCLQASIGGKEAELNDFCNINLNAALVTPDSQMSTPSLSMAIRPRMKRPGGSPKPEPGANGSIRSISSTNPMGSSLLKNGAFRRLDPVTIAASHV